MATESEFIRWPRTTSLPLSYYSSRSFETTGLDQIEKKVAEAVEWARSFATNNIETSELQSPEKLPSAASARSSNRGSNKRLAKDITPSEKEDDHPPSSSRQDTGTPSGAYCMLCSSDINFGPISVK
jgi:hypothetical protein